jgi:hypothetical protein
LRLSDALIGMPMTANIIHTMKQTVNAAVLDATTDHCLCLKVAILRTLTEGLNGS